MLKLVGRRGSGVVGGIRRRNFPIFLLHPQIKIKAFFQTADKKKYTKIKLVWKKLTGLRKIWTTTYSHYFSLILSSSRSPQVKEGPRNRACPTGDHVSDVVNIFKCPCLITKEQEVKYKGYLKQGRLVWRFWTIFPVIYANEVNKKATLEKQVQASLGFEPIEALYNHVT